MEKKEENWKEVLNTLKKETNAIVAFLVSEEGFLMENSDKDKINIDIDQLSAFASGFIKPLKLSSKILSENEEWIYTIVRYKQNYLFFYTIDNQRFIGILLNQDCYPGMILYDIKKASNSIK